LAILKTTITADPLHLDQRCNTQEMD